jgi:hypothetical protein
MLLLTRTVNPAVSAAANVNRGDLRPNPATMARLATHLDIGWDFDGTLVEHSAAPFLHRFIRDHRAIRHVIVPTADGWPD